MVLPVHLWRHLRRRLQLDFIPVIIFWHIFFIEVDRVFLVSRGAYMQSFRLINTGPILCASSSLSSSIAGEDDYSAFARFASCCACLAVNYVLNYFSLLLSSSFMSWLSVSSSELSLKWCFFFELSVYLHWFIYLVYLSELFRILIVSSEHRSLPMEREERGSGHRSPPMVRDERASEHRSLPMVREERGFEHRSIPMVREQRASEHRSLPMEREERANAQPKIP
jgi:hypothetical protein